MRGTIMVRVLAVALVLGMLFAGGRLADAQVVSQCQDYGSGCLHWARADEQDLRIGIRYHDISNVSELADAAAAFSALPYVDMYVAGPTPGGAADCDWSRRAPQGFITWCGGQDDLNDGWAAVTQWGGGIDYGIIDDPEHLYASRIASVSRSPGLSVYIHELRHALGIASHLSGCPNASDVAAYAHVDGYTTALPFTAERLGVNRCGTVSEPTPPPTKCPPGWAKQGRC